MIIGTDDKLETGKTYFNGVMSDKAAKYHHGIAFRVVREATFEEYYQYCKEQDATILNITNIKKCKFYLIQMD